MSGKCRVCERILDLRLGACFECAGFESLIIDGTDMDDEPVKREIEGTDGINILHQILKRYGLLTV